MNKKTRGGQREGAGRKPNGRKQHSIWCKPENIDKVRKLIKENDY